MKARANERNTSLLVIVQRVNTSLLVIVQRVQPSFKPIGVNGDGQAILSSRRLQGGEISRRYARSR